MAKTFKVGDKVRAIDNAYGITTIEYGFEGVVVEKNLGNYKIKQTKPNDWRAGRVWDGLSAKHFELVDAKPTKKQRIKALENEVEALKARIEALEKAKEIDISARIAEKKTPNQRRKAVIERAKAFVADVEERAKSVERNHEGNYMFNEYDTIPEYHVNKEKRVVTVLVKGIHSGRLLEKAIARCAPGDVFNEHIGKAIALAKAYGLECPKEFTDAPQPDKVVVGTVAMHTNDEDVFAIEGVYPHHKYDMRHTSGRYFGMFKMPSAIEEKYTILDDTEAQYE